MDAVRWSFEALDAASAEESLHRVAPNVEFARNPDPRHRLRFAGDDRFTLMHLEVSGEMWGTNEPDDTITVPFAISGRQEWEVGEERGAANLPWLQGFDAQTRAHFGPMDEYATFFMREPLRRFGRAFYGDERFALDFDGVTAISTGHARRLAATLLVAYDVAAADAFDQPLVRSSLYRLIAISVFDSFRLRGDHVTRTLTAEGRLARYRRASQYIADYASLPITVEDVAESVDVGTRELDEIFRGHSAAGEGVTAELRETRLAAAHEDLRRGDPTRGDTVAATAHRWGFASPSAFATAYRRRYGVNPKWVLDR